MLKIKLTNHEYKYLCKASFLSDELQKLIIFCQKHENEYVIELSADQAEEIRDLCAEKLQLVGFDEQYRPTAEGAILESLIDKFFTEDQR